MITLRQQNDIFSGVGRYLLALLFIFKAINCFVHPFANPFGIASAFQFFLVILEGCVWVAAGLSFAFNIWTRVTGVIVLVLASLLIFTTEMQGLESTKTFDGALLSIVFYVSMIGGSLMIASQNMARQENAVSTQLTTSLSTIGRILVGVFYLVIGYLHMVNVAGDAKMIADMPYANIIVIFVGLCWFATALSLWANILSSLSALLASLLIVIITLSINIHAFGHENLLNALMGVVGNLGVIGATLIAGSESSYSFFEKAERR